MQTSVCFKDVVKTNPDGSVSEYLFVPDDDQDETTDEMAILNELNAMPMCDELYVQSQMKASHKPAEDVIADYIVEVERIQNSQFDE